MGGDYKICFNKTNVAHHFWIVVEGSRSVGSAEVWKTENEYYWKMKLDTNLGRKKLSGICGTSSQVIREMVFAIRYEFGAISVQTPDFDKIEASNKENE